MREPEHHNAGRRRSRPDTTRDSRRAGTAADSAAQYPLSKRYARKHLSTRCATARLRRPPAPRAEAATFAREGDETIPVRMRRTERGRSYRRAIHSAGSRGTPARQDRGSVSPSRNGAACARKVSKWSRTSPYRTIDIGSRGSYALDGCATRSPQAPHVPTHGTRQSGVDAAIASARSRSRTARKRDAERESEARRL